MLISFILKKPLIKHNKITEESRDIRNIFVKSMHWQPVYDGSAELVNIGFHGQVDEDDWLGLFLKRAPDLITDDCKPSVQMVVDWTQDLWKNRKCS